MPLIVKSIIAGARKLYSTESTWQRRYYIRLDGLVVIGLLKQLGLGLSVAAIASSDFLQLLTYTAIVIPCDLISSMLFGSIILQRSHTMGFYMGVLPLVLGFLSAFCFDFTKENDLKTLTKAPATKEGAAALMLVIVGRFSNALANILQKKLYLVQGYKDRTLLCKQENSGNQVRITKEDIDEKGELKPALIKKRSFLFRNAILLD